MAEFPFILGAQDLSSVFNDLLNDGASVVPYLAYKSPLHQQVKTPAEAVRMVRDGLVYGPFLISWPDHKPHPYEFCEVKRPEGVRYFLKQKHGGPYMDLLAGKGEQKGEHFLTSGFVAYYTCYWINAVGRETPVSDRLKIKYKSVVAGIRGRSTQVRRDGRIYWIGDEATRLLRSGLATSVQGLAL